MKKIQFSSVEIPKVTLASYPSRTKWIPFGNDNLFPEQLIELTQYSPLHNALIELKSRAIASLNNDLTESEKSVMFGETGSPLLKLISKDLALWNAFTLQINHNPNNTINSIHWLPNKKVRLDIDNNIWFSPDWKKSNKQIKIPFFGSGEIQEALYTYINNQWNDFYSIPSWITAINDIVLDSELSINNLSTVTNSALPSLIFTVRGLQTEEEKENYQEEFSRSYQGSGNSGRFLFQFLDSESQGAEVQQIDNPIDAERFSFYHETTRERLLIAHGVSSPVLAGLPREGALGGDGNEMIVAWDMYMKHHIGFYGDVLSDVFSKIFKRKIKFWYDNYSINNNQ